MTLLMHKYSIIIKQWRHSRYADARIFAQGVSQTAVKSLHVILYKNITNSSELVYY